MKLNWGLRIAALYAGFMLLIAVLVTLSMKQDFQLVSKDYYEKEIRYQEVIDAGKNQSSLSAPVTLVTDEELVVITLPGEFDGKTVKGNVEFYAAVNANWDASFDLRPNGNVLAIPRTSLHPTTYNVKISWEAEGRKYYQETSLNLSQK